MLRILILVAQNCQYSYKYKLNFNVWKFKFSNSYIRLWLEFPQQYLKWGSGNKKLFFFSFPLPPKCASFHKNKVGYHKRKQKFKCKVYMLFLAVFTMENFKSSAFRLHCDRTLYLFYVFKNATLLSINSIVWSLRGHKKLFNFTTKSIFLHILRLRKM